MKKLVTFFACTLLSAASFGQWADFTSGGANWVNLGDLDVSGNQLTVEALITVTNFSAGSDIVSKHTNPSDVNYLLRPGGFEITTTNGYFSVGSSVGISLNKTYHVAATYDGSFLRYYVNGCLTGQAACTGNMFNNNLLAAIGNQSSCQCEPFTGYIDEVRIWNVARTQAQIQASMNTVPGTSAFLVAYYNMNGTFVNQQGTALWDGNMVGSVPFSANPYDATPLPAFNSVSTSVNVDCSGFSNGSISIATVGGNPAYQYALNGGANQTANTFGNLGAGNYTVTVTSADNNCVQQLPVAIMQPAPLAITVLTQTNVLCNGGSNGALTLGATGGTNPGTYSWLPNVSSTNTASNLPAGQYTVTLVDNVCTSNGVELVNNGNFSSGNAGFSSAYAYTPPPNSAAGQYWVATGAQTSSWNGGMFSNGDHSSGTGNYMMVNGAGTAGTSVWCQTIPVTANTNYNFAAWVSSLNNSSPAILQFSINGVPLGTNFSAPATWGTWQQFSASWNSGAATSASICILNQNTTLGGNDFGLDDISFQQCLQQCSTTTVITITEPAPLTNTLAVSSPTVCAGGSVVLTNSISGGTPTYTTAWSSGGTDPGTPVTLTVTPGVTTTYTAGVLDLNGCTSSAVLTVTVNPQPVVTVNSATLCAGQQTATLTAGGANTYTWTPATGLSATSGSMVTATPATTTDYTVTGTAVGGCTATATSAVTVNSLPLITATSATICVGQQTGTLTANGASTYTWSPATGLSSTNGASVNATPGTSAIYTVNGTDVNGCVNTATASVLVNSLPNVTVNSGTICAGTSMTLSANGASTYTWGPAGGLSGTSGNSVTASPASTTVYTLSGTDANTCTSTATSTVAVAPNPTVTAGNASICLGQQTATLTANGATSYTWAPGTGLSSTTGGTVSANPNATTTYTITGAVGTCTAAGTCTVLVNQLPNITATSTVVCNGDPATISASGASTYTWSTLATGNTITVSPNLTSTYSVAGTDGNGCMNATTATVTVNPLPNVTVNSAAICSGSSVMLTANNALVCAWSPGTGLSATVGNSVNASPAATTQYTVTGTDVNGCSNSALSTVTVNPLPNITVTSATLCAGNSGSLTASGANFFNWNPSTGLSSSTVANPTASPNSTTAYTVTGTDVNNCQNTATATVTVNQLPAVSATPAVSSGCAPLCVNFSNTGNNSISSSFSWNFGNGTTSPNPDPQSCYASAGTFTTTLTLTDSNGCKNTSSAIVNVYPVPAANFGAGPQPTTILDPNIQFYNYSSGAVIYSTQWDFGDGNTSTVSNPLHVFADTGMYYVQLTVTSNYGCSATTTQPVYIAPEFLIYVPNAFTPNGDELNDIFLPKGEGISEYTLFIFDRWGQQIFESDDIYKGWDGKKGETYLQEDVYVWKIVLRNNQGEPRRLAGIVSLLK